MIGLIRRLLGNSEQETTEEDKPGRTFKRILTTEYFGLQDPGATQEAIAEAKADKLNKVKEHDLEPKFVRYALKERDGKKEVIAAHVVFQNELYDKKWHMVHVTEVSFVVPKEEFEEFETMFGVSLQDDFRDLTEYDESKKYRGKERRRRTRPSVLEV